MPSARRLCLTGQPLLIVLLWLLPTLVYANLVTLLYFALHFDSIVSKLGGDSISREGCRQTVVLGATRDGAALLI